MSTTEEERIRKVEDTLLLLPPQLEAIRNTQVEIIEHLEDINGSFGELDQRIYKVETKWEYQEHKIEDKKEGKKHFLNLGNFIIAGVVAIQGIIVSFLALS